MFSTREFYFIVYLIAVNIYGFIMMGLDKKKSRRGSWRISEKRLFTAAFLGGAAGVMAGMKVFHHKTLHNKFKYGIPVIIILNAAAAIYIWRFI